MRWLHISDLHFTKNTSSESTEMRNGMLEYCKSLESSENPIDTLFFTGDYRFSKDKSPYDIEEDVESAAKFVYDLMKNLSVKTERVFFVPGNHDLYRSEPWRLIAIEKDRAAYNGYIGTFGKEYNYFNDFHFYAEFLKRLDKKNKRNYFYKEFFKTLVDQSSPHKWYSYNDYNLVLLNTALLHTDADEGKAIVGSHGLKECNLDKEKPLIILAHHGLFWLDSRDREFLFKKFNRENSVTLYLCGHVHKGHYDVRNNIHQISVGCIVGDETGPYEKQQCFSSGVFRSEKFFDINMHTWRREKRKRNEVTQRLEIEQFSWAIDEDFGKEKKETDDMIGSVSINGGNTLKGQLRIFSKPAQKPEVILDQVRDYVWNLPAPSRDTLNPKNTSLDYFVNEVVKLHIDKELANDPKYMALLILFSAHNKIHALFNEWQKQTKNKYTNNINNVFETVVKVPQFSDVLLALSLGNLAGEEWKSFFEELLSNKICLEFDEDDNSFKSPNDVDYVNTPLDVFLLTRTGSELEKLLTFNEIQQLKVFVSHPNVYRDYIMSSYEDHYDAPDILQSKTSQDLDVLEGKFCERVCNNTNCTHRETFPLDLARRAFVTLKNIKTIMMSYSEKMDLHLLDDEFPGVRIVHLKPINITTPQIMKIYPVPLPISIQIAKKFVLTLEGPDMDTLINKFMMLVDERFSVSRCSCKSIMRRIHTIPCKYASIETLEEEIIEETANFFHDHNLDAHCLRNDTVKKKVFSEAGVEGYLNKFIERYEKKANLQ